MPARDEISVPFDQISKDYDQDFSQTILGRWLRRQVWDRLAKNLQPGDHLLELGCGTGEDAVWLGQQGIRVTATDHSSAMLGIVREKIERRSLGHLVSTQLLDLNHPHAGIEDTFDGVLANFGVLNCVRDRQHLAEILHGWLKAEAHAIFVIMNPYCPWEIIWHLSDLQINKAFRRLKQGGLDVALGEHSELRVCYPRPGLVKQEFKPGFRLAHLQGLGVFLPPSYLRNLIIRHMRFFELLHKLEKKLARRFPWNRLSDHYIIELIRS